MVERVDLYLENTKSELSTLVGLGYLDLVKKRIVPWIQLEFYLLTASRNGHWEVVQLLLDKGANIHDHDDQPFHYACERGHLEVVKLLLDKGADIHSEKDYGFRVACYKGYLEIVQFLSELGSPAGTYDNEYAFCWACDGDQIEVIKFLLDNGASTVSKHEGIGRGAERGNLDTVRFLMEQGADIHIGNDYPLRAAAMNGWLEVVQFLLDYGANSSTITDNTLRSINEHGYPEVYQTLLDHRNNHT